MSNSFFDWHWFPENPKVQSVVEIIVFCAIVFSCSFLYYRWNIVPNKEFQIQVEDLSDGVAYDSTRVRIDSIRRVLTCDITCNIPMTRNEDFIKEKKYSSINFHSLYSNEKYSDFLKYTFFSDSLRNGLSSEASYVSVMKKYNLAEESEVKKRFNIVPQIVESYKKTLMDSLKPPRDSCIMATVSMKQSRPYFSQLSRTGWNRGNRLIDHKYFLDKNKYFCSDTYFYFDNKGNCPQTTIVVDQRSIIESRLQEISNFFNIYAPFEYGGPLMTPPWGRLEDISQAYVNVKLESYTIDSIVVNIDFIGATEFSAMDPIPDKVGMSNIIFSDPIKIYKIKTNGLRFHARFIELENWQQIRVFTVTAIMSAFVIVFVVFIISAYFKIRKKIQANGGHETHKHVRWVLFFVGIILYNIFYWTFMTFAIEDTRTRINFLHITVSLSSIICNLMTAPTVLLILSLSNRKGRGILARFINKQNFKKAIIFTSIFFSLVLLCFAYYKVANMDIKQITHNQSYGRATKEIYSQIIRKNYATKDDVKQLRQVLLGASTNIPDTINGKYGKYRDGLLASYSYFSNYLDLYDFKNQRAYHYTMPEITNVDIFDSLIVVCSGNNNYSILKKDNLSFQLFDLGQHKSFVGLTENRDTAIFYENVISYDTAIFYKNVISYTSISDGTTYKRIPIDKSVKGYPSRVMGRYVITTMADSFYVYRMNDFSHFDLCYKSTCEQRWRRNYYGSNGNYMFLNTEGNLLIYRNNGIEYIVDLTPGKNYIDSLPEHNWNTEIIPSHLWNRNTINVLKKASDKNNVYMGFDYSHIYLYNFKDTCVEVFNWRGFLIKKQKVKGYESETPALYTNKRGTFFVQMQSDSIYKYDMNGLVDTIAVNRSAKSILKNDYIIEESTDKIIIRPFANPSDSYIVTNKNNFAGSSGIPQDDIDIINGWMLRKGDDCYIENIRSTNSLILNSKYLTKSQKNRLIGILKKDNE